MALDLLLPAFISNNCLRDAATSCNLEHANTNKQQDGRKDNTEPTEANNRAKNYCSSLCQITAQVIIRWAQIIRIVINVGEVCTSIEQATLEVVPGATIRLAHRVIKTTFTEFFTSAKNSVVEVW